MSKTTITGYQYSPESMRYTGPYTFPNNLDKKAVHLPPNTVLDEPPATPAGKAAFREDGAWVVRSDTAIAISKPVIDDYALLTESAIGQLKLQGLWTDTDQSALESSIASLEQEHGHGD